MAVFLPHIFYLDGMLNSQIFNKRLRCNYLKYNMFQYIVSFIPNFHRPLKLLCFYQNYQNEKMGYGPSTQVELSLILGQNIFINVKNMYNEVCKCSHTEFRKDRAVGYLFWYFHCIKNNYSNLQEMLLLKIFFYYSRCGTKRKSNLYFKNRELNVSSRSLRCLINQAQVPFLLLL